MLGQLKSSKNGDFYRFLMSGAANTALTYILFLFLSRSVHHAVAYTVAYVAGLIFSYVVAVRFVFRTKFDLRSAFCFPFVYIAQYLYGLIVLTALTDGINLARELSMAVVIITSVPLTFLLTRSALKRRAHLPQADTSVRLF